MSIMSSVGSSRGSVECRILVKSDFLLNDTSLQSSDICTVLVALMKSSVDCSLRLDLSVSGCSIVVRYLDSW